MDDGHDAGDQDEHMDAVLAASGGDTSTFDSGAQATMEKDKTEHDEHCGGSNGENFSLIFFDDVGQVD